ncbi:MAG: hypothetical protein L0312_24100 [Acidobacteria bacterium]|nr:hypothetical protein [Acidobacteriota bacterium]
MSVQFKPLGVSERESLLVALRRNASESALIHMNPRNTRFAGLLDAPASDETDEQVIDQIKSAPCHY